MARYHDGEYWKILGLIIDLAKKRIDKKENTKYSDIRYILEAQWKSLDAYSTTLF